MDTLSEDTKIKGFVYRKRLLFDSNSGTADFTELKCENGSYGTLSSPHKYGSKSKSSNKKTSKDKENGTTDIDTKDVVERNPAVKKKGFSVLKEDKDEVVERSKLSGIFRSRKIVVIPMSETKPNPDFDDEFQKVCSKEESYERETDMNETEALEDSTNSTVVDDTSDDSDSSPVQVEITSDEKAGLKQHDGDEYDDSGIHDETLEQILSEDEYSHIEKIYRASFQEKVATFENFSKKINYKPPVYPNKSRYKPKKQPISSGSSSDDNFSLEDTSTSSGSSKTRYKGIRSAGAGETNGIMKRKCLNESFVHNGSIQSINLGRSKSMPTLNEEDDNGKQAGNLESGPLSRVLAKSSDEIHNCVLLQANGEDFSSVSPMSKSSWASMFSKRLQQIRQKFEQGCNYEKASLMKQRLSNSIKNSPLGKRFSKKTAKDKQEILNAGLDDGHENGGLCSGGSGYHCYQMGIYGGHGNTDEEDSLDTSFQYCKDCFQLKTT